MSITILSDLVHSNYLENCFVKSISLWNLPSCQRQAERGFLSFTGDEPIMQNLFRIWCFRFGACFYFGAIAQLFMADRDHLFSFLNAL
jgi:hypothetical protein